MTSAIQEVEFLQLCLNAPNIVQILDIAMDDGFCQLVFPRAQGGFGARLLSPLPLPEIHSYCLDLAEGRETIKRA